ncbi:MAG TPA: hypothetical protein VFI25_01885 [Planctomycetota bacterium]|jgi:hypothetical protein|nr:hypothetical protein [Planctomycetota bacterium]
MLPGLSAMSATAILEAAAAEPEKGPDRVVAVLERARLRPTAMNPSPWILRSAWLQAPSGARAASGRILGAVPTADVSPASAIVLFPRRRQPWA